MFGGIDPSLTDDMQMRELAKEAHRHGTATHRVGRGRGFRCVRVFLFLLTRLLAVDCKRGRFCRYQRRREPCICLRHEGSELNRCGADTRARRLAPRVSPARDAPVRVHALAYELARRRRTPAGQRARLGRARKLAKSFVPGRHINTVEKDIDDAVGALAGLRDV